MKRKRILRSTPDQPRAYRSRRQRQDEAYERDVQRSALHARNLDAAEKCAVEKADGAQAPPRNKGESQ